MAPEVEGMKRTRFCWAFAVLICGVVGGAGESMAQSVSELPFVELNRGFFAQNGRVTKKQTKVISSQEEYAAELAVYSSRAPATVDFAAGRVLLVDMGRRNTGGYSIVVTSVSSGRNSVVANIQLTKPGESCITTQAITNPYQFVFIPSLEEILVSETVKIARCYPLTNTNEY